MTGNGITYNSNYKPWLQATNTNAVSWGATGASGWGATGLSFQGTSGWGNAGWGNSVSYGTSSLSSSSSSRTKTAEEQKQARDAATQKVIENRKKKNASTIFQGFTKKEEEKLLKQHSITFEPTAKLGSSLLAGLGLGSLMKNGGMFSHPWNSAKTALRGSATNQMFKGKDEIWKNFSNLTQEAYYQMHKVERRSNSHWFKIFRKSYTQADDGVFKQYQKLMEDAIKSGNPERLAEVTELGKRINVKDGWLTNAWRKLRGKPMLNPADELTKGLDDIAKGAMRSSEGVQTLLKYKNVSLKQAFNQAKGGKVGLILGALGFLMEIGNISKAFKKDKKDGWKQTGQSVAKFGANYLGYMAGETIGIWGGAKLGALIGSVVPGLGTAVGALAGMLCGTIVSHFAGKGVRAIVGDNVSNEIQTKNLTKTEDGIKQIKQDLIAQAERGEIKDQETLDLISKFEATA